MLVSDYYIVVRVVDKPNGLETDENWMYGRRVYKYETTSGPIIREGTLLVFDPMGAAHFKVNGADYMHLDPGAVKGEWTC